MGLQSTNYIHNVVRRIVCNVDILKINCKNMKNYVNTCILAQSCYPEHNTVFIL